ncbi:MAG: tRNA lysidine(34) synthetase TilS [Bifidobacterium tibiigranuli]|nr:tRNA lysidine(34) synthetase TilS [Bifidobacterium tibiigranuli]
MTYTSRLRAGTGCVRGALERLGITLQDARFAEHGEHTVSPDAPLVLVACSGGRDSMALAALSRTVCASLGVRCGAVIVDHGLQRGSDAVAQQAAQRCSQLGLEPVTVHSVHVEVGGSGIEAAARQARYQAIVAVAQRCGASVVLLAHTKDDQAETIVIDLLRSGGLDALAGMPESFVLDSVRFARPLLSLTREQTTGICQDLGLPWWDDPTNGDGFDANEELPADFPLRSRIRHSLIPYLRCFSGGDVVAHLAGMAQTAALDKEYLDMQADRVAAAATQVVHAAAGGEADAKDASLAVPALSAPIAPGAPSIPVALIWSVDALRGNHAAIRRRVIAHGLSSLGIAASSRHVEAIDRLIADWHGQGPVSLPSGYTAIRKKHVIRLCQDGGHANR